jgi:RNA polymerase sigma-70 factor (ECF subfamily)
MSATQSLAFGNLKSSAYGTAAVTQRRSATNRSPYCQKSAFDEAFVIERLKTGDSEALETIFNTYSKKLYNVAQQIVGEAADTQEVIQDVFWIVFQKAQSFRGNSWFSTWLYRLTVNAPLIKLRQRKKNREVTFGASLCKFRKDHHRAQPLVDWADTLKDKYARREMQALFCSALQELEPIDKSVAVLSHLKGLSAKKIATTVGLTVSAVKTRLHRARLFLRGRVFQAQSNDNSKNGSTHGQKVEHAASDFRAKKILRGSCIGKERRCFRRGIGLHEDRPGSDRSLDSGGAYVPWHGRIWQKRYSAQTAAILRS